MLEDLTEMLAEIASGGQFLWNNKQVVPLYVPEQHEPWAAVQTKKLDAVYLHLSGPKGRFTLGQLTDLGYNPELDGQRPDDRRDPPEVSHAGRPRPRRPARVFEEAPGGGAGKVGWVEGGQGSGVRVQERSATGGFAFLHRTVGARILDAAGKQLLCRDFRALLR